MARHLWNDIGPGLDISDLDQWFIVHWFFNRLIAKNS